MKLLINFLKDFLEVIYAFGEHKIRFKRIKKIIFRIVFALVITVLIALRVVILIFQQITNGFDNLAYLIHSIILVMLIVVVYKKHHLLNY